MIAAYQGFLLLQLKSVSPRNTEFFADSGWQVVFLPGLEANVFLCFASSVKDL